LCVYVYASCEKIAPPSPAAHIYTYTHTHTHAGTNPVPPILCGGMSIYVHSEYPSVFVIITKKNSVLYYLHAYTQHTTQMHIPNTHIHTILACVMHMQAVPCLSRTAGSARLPSGAPSMRYSSTFLCPAAHSAGPPACQHPHVNPHVHPP
jgi:hypothetical protein